MPDKWRVTEAGVYVARDNPVTGRPEHLELFDWDSPSPFLDWVEHPAGGHMKPVPRWMYEEFAARA